jgi:hypothetical protein
MPKIASGSSAVVSIPAGSVISVDSGGGMLRFECPTGTVLYEGDGVAQTFGPYTTTKSATITSLFGGVDYVVASTPDQFSSGRKRIAVGIVGQSNEVGQVLYSDFAGYPEVFRSAQNPNVAMPLPLTNAGHVSGGLWRPHGSMFIPFYDALWDWGYDAHLVVGAIGSMSLLRDACGFCQGRSNSTAYRAVRAAAAGTGDLGHSGDLTVQGGKLFRCTTGSQVYATYNSPTRLLATNQHAFQNIVNADSKSSAASDPGTWAAAPLGGTVADGSLVWTNIDNTNSLGFSNSQIFSETQAGIGFDPFGILYRLHEGMQRIQGVSEKWILIANAQSDAAYNSTQYQTAVTNIASYYLDRGYNVACGLSTYNSLLAGVTTGYDAMTTGVNAAIAALQTTWGSSRVKAGANLYTRMGIVTGQNGLSFTADGVHIDAPAAIVAGRHHADAFKAFLPRQVPR